MFIIKQLEAFRPGSVFFVPVSLSLAFFLYDRILMYCIWAHQACHNWLYST